MPAPALTTDRLDLVPVSTEQVDAWHAVWGDPRVIWWGHDADLDATRARVERLVAVCEGLPDGLGWWLAVDRATGAGVGTTALDHTPVPEGAIEIGWHLRRDVWGSGYATEAASAVLEHAFGTVRLATVVATIVPENGRSVRVAERLGMTRVRPDVRRSGWVHGVWSISR